jgi:hypothetical protein
MVQLGDNLGAIPVNSFRKIAKSSPKEVIVNRHRVAGGAAHVPIDAGILHDDKAHATLGTLDVITDQPFSDSASLVS